VTRATPRVVVAVLGLRARRRRASVISGSQPRFSIRLRADASEIVAWRDPPHGYPKVLVTVWHNGISVSTGWLVRPRRGLRRLVSPIIILPAERCAEHRPNPASTWLCIQREI